MASWGSQVDLAATLSPAKDNLELEYDENKEEVIPQLLVSEDDDEDSFFLPSPLDAKPNALLAHREDKGSATASPAISMDMQTVCKRAASRLTSPGLR